MGQQHLETCSRRGQTSSHGFTSVPRARSSSRTGRRFLGLARDWQSCRGSAIAAVTERSGPETASGPDALWPRNALVARKSVCGPGDNADGHRAWATVGRLPWSVMSGRSRRRCPRARRIARSDRWTRSGSRVRESPVQAPAAGSLPGSRRQREAWLDITSVEKSGWNPGGRRQNTLGKPTPPGMLADRTPLPHEEKLHKNIRCCIRSSGSCSRSGACATR